MTHWGETSQLDEASISGLAEELFVSFFVFSSFISLLFGFEILCIFCETWRACQHFFFFYLKKNFF